MHRMGVADRMHVLSRTIDRGMDRPFGMAVSVAAVEDIALPVNQMQVGRLNLVEPDFLAFHPQPAPLGVAPGKMPQRAFGMAVRRSDAIPPRQIFERLRDIRLCRCRIHEPSFPISALIWAKGRYQRVYPATMRGMQEAEDARRPFRTAALFVRPSGRLWIPWKTGGRWRRGHQGGKRNSLKQKGAIDRESIIAERL